jgi:hypothetical protein
MENNHADRGGSSPSKDAEELDDTPPNNFKNDDNFRYFKDNIICFKCNKVGHYKAVCPENSVCLYCFSAGHEA